MNARSTPGEILKRHFEKLKKQNSKFSLRSLAQKLEVSHSFLVRLFNDKANVPIDMMEPLIAALKIDQLEAANLKRGIVSKRAKVTPEMQILDTAAPASDLKDYTNLPEMNLSIMRNWWNFAIMDLLTCDMGIKFTAETIARFIPIGTAEIQRSLDDLVRAGLVAVKNDIYIKTAEKFRFPTRGPNPITRDFYKQGLKLAAAELNRTDQESFERRLIMGFSCAANRKKIPLAKQRLAAALREAASLLAEGDCDDVFCVQGQMFSVLKK